MPMPVTLPAEGWIDQKKVIAVTGIPETTLKRLIKAGRAPAPIKVGPRLIRWKVSAIRAYLAAPGEYRAPQE